jgi:hypothetical protein
MKLLLFEFRRFLDREPWCAEFWSGTTALIWAMMTYSGLERFRDWPSMRVLCEIGNDHFWHLLGLGLGACQIAVLVSDRRWARWLVAVAQGWFWGVLTLAVWVATPWSPAVAIYAGWCAINVSSIMRLLRPMLVSAWPVH